MKIVQTFWSCKIDNITDLKNFKAGWHSNYFHYMGWMLSCLQLRGFYDEVELVTDAVGKQLLIDELGLPYTNVRVVLDDTLRDCPEQFWATPKVLAYNIQEKPFIHIDGDVFITKPFSSNLENAEIISQYIEDDFNCYNLALDAVERHNLSVPNEILLQREKAKKPIASNMGIFGGNNLEFINQYSSTALNFSKQYYSVSEIDNLPYFNCLFEQELMYCMAQSKSVNINYFFDMYSRNFDRYNFRDPLAQLDSKGTNEFGYVHLGGGCKKSYSNCIKLLYVLREKFPQYYKRLNRTIEKKNPIRMFLEFGLKDMFLK
jgi:hypothetical protein